MKYVFNNITNKTKSEWDFKAILGIDKELLHYNVWIKLMSNWPVTDQVSTMNLNLKTVSKLFFLN